MKATKARDGYVDRIIQFPAYPDYDQMNKIENMQPSLRAAWNWLVSIIDQVLKAREAKAMREGLLPSPIPKPCYTGLSDEKAKALKDQYAQDCKDRQKKIFDLPIPVEWRPFLQGKDSEAARLGMKHDYQVLNNYLEFKNLPKLPAVMLQALVKNFSTKNPNQKRKRFRRQSDIMPIQVRSGELLRSKNDGTGKFKLQKKCNYELHLRGIGWIPVYLDAGLVNQLMAPGNTIRQGCALKYMQGRWVASVRIIRREVMHPGPGDNSICGIDPGLDKLAAISDGQVLKNPRNPKYYNARDLALSIINLGEGKTKFISNENRRLLNESVYRHDMRQKRKIQTQCRQIAAALCSQYDFIGIESNSAIALGIGSRFTGSTKFLLKCLIERCGHNRVREVESFYNSQVCSQCGHHDKETWARKIGSKDQTCSCLACGFTEDRDVNSARNVRNKLAEQLGLT